MKGKRYDKDPEGRKNNRQEQIRRGDNKRALIRDFAKGDDLYFFFSACGGCVGGWEEMLSIYHTRETSFFNRAQIDSELFVKSSRFPRSEWVTPFSRAKIN